MHSWLSLSLPPVLTGALGVLAGYIGIRFDARKTSNQELIKKRIAIYDNMVPKLNDLICFFMSKGAWKGMSPPSMIQRKRELDHSIYIYSPLFPEAVFEQYQIFIHKCFRTYTGVGRDACLRANHHRIKTEWGKAWLPEWDHHFANQKDIIKDVDLTDEYEKLLKLLAASIGTKQKFPRKR